PYGNIATCGNAASITLATTVMPFIIRGLSILGVASAGTARALRDEVWRQLAGPWKPAHLATIAGHEVDLAALPATFATMIGGGSLGRTLVRLA
ncbi:MAG: oxidoreductase, partial [Rhodanobacteraceae bacterium]|nr:oxidoreductase [Rhodanobacteraceae bacterium]